MTAATTPQPFHGALLSDGTLGLAVSPGARSAVERWIPRLPPLAPAPGAPTIHVDTAPAAAASLPGGAATIELTGTSAWVDGAAGRAVLADARLRLAGTVDLGTRCAEVRLPQAADPERLRRSTAGALTLAAALLLNRQERLLFHAGAVVAPEGRAWLLVGDTHSGKSSSCAALVRAGWDFLADDQLVVGAEPGSGEIWVEGWPRPFNLDPGFATGLPSGRRVPVEPEDLRAGAWRQRAPLGGLLFPRLAPSRPTELEALPGADALGALIRQSPWSFVDAVAAPAQLAFMVRMASLPAFILRLGLDAYGDPTRLAAALEPALTTAATHA
jgi:hypothetical protein